MEQTRPSIAQVLHKIQNTRKVTAQLWFCNECNSLYRSWQSCTVSIPMSDKAKYNSTSRIEERCPRGHRLRYLLALESCFTLPISNRQQHFRNHIYSGKKTRVIRYVRRAELPQPTRVILHEQAPKVEIKRREPISHYLVDVAIIKGNLDDPMYREFLQMLAKEYREIHSTETADN